jgi:dethiobiotin synthetase
LREGGNLRFPGGGPNHPQTHNQTTMKKLLITSTGTDIGKTHYICNLIKNLKKQGKTVKALKPIISGLDFNDLKNNDSAQILKALGEKITKENILKISPFNFKTPASPDIAAQQENKPQLNYEELTTFCQNFLNDNSHDYALIEGVGGIMVPINQQKTTLNLIKDLNIENILITGNYLGTISHTLTALETLKSHKIKIKEIIFNNYPNQNEEQLEFNKQSIFTHL